MLDEQIQYSPRSGPLCSTGVSRGQQASSTQTASRSHQPFLPGSLGDRPTVRPIDHASRSVTIGGAHCGEVKFCYCLWLQQVFIGAVDSTDRINFGNQQLYSAVRLDRCNVSGVIRQYSLEENVSHRRTHQVTQLFTYLLTHKLFSSFIRRYLMSRACD